MGEISKLLHARLKTMASGSLLPKAGKGLKAFPGAPDVEKLIAVGFDPVHAVYLFVHHTASFFAHSVSQLPELHGYAKEIGKARNRYVPDGPPISPLTASFFESWSLFDLQIGRSTDTLASCLIDANDVIGVDRDQVDALRKLNDSRMGIYEHQGLVEDLVILRELVSNREFTAHIPSGYRGAFGELWYLRLLPPLLPDLATYHVAFTTPYILNGAAKRDWVQYLRRTMVGRNAPSEHEALRRVLKFGSRKNTWPEFVYHAYHYAESNAIFLSGIPDLRETLPGV